MEETNTPAAEPAPAKTDERLLAVLSSIPLIGLIIYFVMSDASPFVKNYARQGGMLFIVGLILGIIPVVNCIAGLVVLIGMLMLIINALQENKTFRLPVIADLAEKIFTR